MNGTITRLLHRWNDGDREAFESLLPLVYDRLKAQAARSVSKESQPLIIQPTELLHEVYLRMAGTRNPGFRDRSHFYGVAGALMRRVLVDCARRRKADKRRPGELLVDLGHGTPSGSHPVDFELLDAALERLARQDPRQAKVVELRYFGGMSLRETADHLGVSEATVKRDWRVAKAWLLRELRG